MKMVTPNGSKIVELRKARGLYQKVLAGKASLSERTMREIETKNKSILEFKLVDIATALGVKVEEIIISQEQTTNNEEEYQSPHQLQLKAMESGKDLWEMCREAKFFQWGFSVQPTLKSAEIMEDALKILRRMVYGRNEHTYDEFDAKYMFTDLFRVARLDELLKDLSAEGINLVANTYFYVEKRDENDTDTISEFKTERRMAVNFTSSDQTTKLIFAFRGHKYSEYQKRYGGDKYGDLDDDIPF